MDLCVPWLLIGFKREEIRNRFGIEGNVWKDVLVSSDNLGNRPFASR